MAAQEEAEEPLCIIGLEEEDNQTGRKALHKQEGGGPKSPCHQKLGLRSIQCSPGGSGLSLKEEPEAEEGACLCLPEKRRADRSKFRSIWTKEEDAILAAFVEEEGKERWARMAQLLGGRRSGKQCRNRWYNVLDPELVDSEWTPEEERRLVALHRQMGSRWAMLAKHMPGRSENAIKNHWHCTARCKELRNMKRARNVVLREYIHQLRSAPPESKTGKARAPEQPPRKRVRTKRRLSRPATPTPLPRFRNTEPALPKADVSITLKAEEVTSAGCAPNEGKLPGAGGGGESVGEGFHTRPGSDTGVLGNADREAGQHGVKGLKVEVGEIGDVAETERFERAELPNRNPLMETKPGNGQLTWITHWLDPQGHGAGQLSYYERTRLGEILGAEDAGGSTPPWGVGLRAKGCPPPVPQDHDSWVRGLPLACCGPESKPPVSATVEGRVNEVVKESYLSNPRVARGGMGRPASRNDDVSWASSPRPARSAPKPRTLSAAAISGLVADERPAKMEWGSEETLPLFADGRSVAGESKSAASFPLGKRKSAEPGIESLLESLQVAQTEVPPSMAPSQPSLEALMSGGLSLGAEGRGGIPLPWGEGGMKWRPKKRPAPIRVHGIEDVHMPNVKTPSVACPRISAGFGSSASAPCLLSLKPSGSRSNLSPTRSLTQNPDRMNISNLLGVSESPSNLDLTAMVMEHISGLLDEQEEHLTRVDPACPEASLEPGDVQQFLEQHTQMRAAVGFLTSLTGGLPGAQGKPVGSAGSLENSVGSQDWPKEAAGESVGKEPGYAHQAFSEVKGGASSDRLEVAVHGDWNRSWEMPGLPSDAPRVLTGENDQPLAAWPGSEEWQPFSFQGQATELEPLATWRPAVEELGPKSGSTAGDHPLPFLGPTTPIMLDWDQQFKNWAWGEGF